MASSSKSSQPKFRQAELEDLREDEPVWVRGRKALVTMLDFPLVYYRFDGDDFDKHRSYVSSRELFQIKIGGNDGDERGPADDNDAGVGSGADDTKHAGDPDAGSQGPPTSSSSSSSSGSASGGSASAQPPQNQEQVKNNMFNAFASRPRKVAFENLTNENVECDARMPQSVFIANCANCVFKISRKVSSLMLDSCTNCSVSFCGTVSSCEIFRSSKCTVICTTGCSMWTVDSSNECSLSVPASMPASTFVSTADCIGLKFVARQPNHAIVDSVDVSGDADNVANGSGQGTSSSSGSPQSFVQITTKWDGSSGKFTSSSRLDRHGHGGYPIL